MEKMNDNKAILIPNKRLTDMAISKGLLFMLNLFGISAYVYALFLAWINVDVFTRTVLAFIGMVYAAVKVVSAIVSLYHRVDTYRRNKRKEDFKQMQEEDEYIRNRISL